MSLTSVPSHQFSASPLGQFDRTPLKQRGMGFICRIPKELFGSLLWPADSYSWDYELAWEPGPWITGYTSGDGTIVPSHYGPGSAVGRILPGSQTLIRLDMESWATGYGGPPALAGVDAPSFWGPLEFGNLTMVYPELAPVWVPASGDWEFPSGAMLFAETLNGTNYPRTPYGCFLRRGWWSVSYGLTVAPACAAWGVPVGTWGSYGINPATVV